MSRCLTLRDAIALGFAMLVLAPACASGGVTSEQVERAIREGVRFLKSQQQPDGSWTEAEAQVKTGTTSLVTLALLTAGEKVDSPTIQAALEHLRGFGPEQLHNTYAIGLQTMAFAAAEPERDRLRLLANVNWLEKAQLKPGDRAPWPGTWTYSENKSQPGDHSNTQYALLGLNAASETGVVVKPEVWALSRAHFERYQGHDGGWAYTPRNSPSTGSMTYVNHHAVLVAADVKDDPVVADEIDIGTEGALHIGRPVPHGPADRGMPAAQRAFRLRMPLPEQAQCPLGDHLHETIVPYLGTDVNTAVKTAPPSPTSRRSCSSPGGRT